MSPNRRLESVAKSSTLSTSLGLRNDHLDTSGHNCFGGHIVLGMVSLRRVHEASLVKHLMRLDRMTPTLFSVSLRPGGGFAPDGSSISERASARQ